MKMRPLAISLLLCALLTLPVSALSSQDFKRGSLSGITAEADGSLLITDVFHKVVWQVKNGEVSRFAGATGVADPSGEPTGLYHDGDADKAYFMEPWDIEAFSNGYAVSDAGANVIRLIRGGHVYTLAGSGKAGDGNGASRQATFRHPTGLAAGTDGALYIADTGNGAIRRVAADGGVTTVTSGLVEPTGLCWHDGALYVAETGRSRILRVANGKAEVYAGVSEQSQDAGEYIGGYVDGAVSAARFDHPQGLAFGSDGTLFVTDMGNSAVRAIYSGRVYTVARSSDSAIMPASPCGIAVAGDTLYAADLLAGSVLMCSAAQKSYADVAPDAWYAADVEEASRLGLTNGTSEHRFSPETVLSRAMFVTMISRVYQIADGAARINGETGFTDFSDSAEDWYSAPARWAADNDIVRGIDGQFSPNTPITRQEIVTMLYRFAVAQKLGASAGDTDKLSQFSDAADTADWAKEAMTWATNEGIIQGADGNLRPGMSATRAESTRLLLNFMRRYSL